MAVVKPSFSFFMATARSRPMKRRRTTSRSRSGRFRRRRRQSRKFRATTLYKRSPIGGFRPHTVVRLRYSDVITIDPGSGGAGTGVYLFQANNIYDPDYSGTGHQPLYRDTWAGIYASYLVLGAKIRLIFEPVRNVAVINSTDVVGDTQPYTVGCLLSESVSDYPTSTNTLVELGGQRRCRFKVIPAMAANRFTNVVQTFSPKKLYGLKDTRDHLSELAANVGAGPTKGAYFIAFASNADNAANPVAISCRVIIDYLVMFYDIIDAVTAS